MCFIFWHFQYCCFFENDKDLNQLIDRLSVIINKVEDIESKITLAQEINLVLSDMAQSAGINYKPPTTMENMLDFLAKNINDPSLKSLSAMNRPEMLQGLLSAPGVFTPLLHFLVPMNMDGMKAFGELWADPDADGAKTGEDGNHLFLSICPMCLCRRAKQPAKSSKCFWRHRSL